jgi:hypothetical protein
MHKYWGFGLRIASEIEFPELFPFDFSDADVTINFGKVPQRLESDDVVAKRAFSSVSKDEYLLNIKSICKYYAGFGNKIIAEPEPDIDEHSLRLFLLGTVMAAILYQRDSIPLHSSAIIKDNKLILFAGNSGAGKSTLLASLATKGYQIFTDDICVIKQDINANRIAAGAASYPMIKLWEDSIAKLDDDLFTRDFKIRPKLPKYGQFFYDVFNTNWYPVDKIFILHAQNSADKIQVRQLTSVEAFKKLEKQAYRYQLITNTKLRMLHFSLMSQMVTQSPVYEVGRPAHGSTIELLFDALQNLI